MLKYLSHFLNRMPFANVRLYTSSRVIKPVRPLAFELHLPVIHNPEPATAILFLHGLFGSKKNNRAISKVLAKDLSRPVYALDLRNHGESPQDATHDYDSMASDVVAFIEDHNLEAPVLIGHSMGAKAAMTVALRWPGHVSQLVAVDNAPLDAAIASKFAQYIRGMKKVEAARVTRQADADKILKDYEESPSIRQFLLGNLFQPTGTTARQFRIPLPILEKSIHNMGDFPLKDPAIVRFEKPALFVRGTQSHYVPDEVLPLIGQFFPLFRLVDIDAGHWVISEKPEEFRAAVVDFLKT